jgi:hypothetical protein
MDRRFSKTLPRINLDSGLIDHILGLAQESDLTEGVYVNGVLHDFPNFLDPSS